MASDDPFEPKLGRIRAQTPKIPKSHQGKVLHAVNRAGGMRGGKARPGRMAKFGRGAGVARVLSGSSSQGVRSRRVVVKARFVKLAGKGLQAAVAHLRYLQRDGVTREGERGELYGATLEGIDAKDFMKSCDGDRHQFRFIVAPEDGAQYDTLKPLTRKVMAQMETDLGTKLDWVAVDHFNTGHPHTHIVVRGRDDKGADLVISREYMSQGFRERVQAQVLLDLGPRSDLDIVAARQAEVTQERLTSIDRSLLRDKDNEGLVAAVHRDGFTQGLRTARLAQLQRFGLAEPLRDNIWRLHTDMEATLQQMATRGDIIKTLHQSLQTGGRTEGMADAIIHGDLSSPTGLTQPVIGRLLERGLADENGDRHFVVVEGTDGRMHYADIGNGVETPVLPTGAIVQLTANRPDLRPADATIARVAAQSGGYYDVELHLKAEPNARQDFAQTHVRRLEAIRRETGGVERDTAGRFAIPADYAEVALKYEVKLAARRPILVETLSAQSLSEQVRHPGVTWLDKALTQEKPPPLALSGFGQETRGALQQRLQWLVEEGLAFQSPDGNIQTNPGYMSALHKREFAAVATAVSKELGLPYSAAQTGEQIEGRLRRSVTLGSGKYAVVDRGRDFTLVPWRPVLEKHIDKTVSGIMRDKDINWSFGKSRGLTPDM